MKNKKVVWVGNKKVLPFYGVAINGRVIVMTTCHADNHINQGNAIAYKAKPKTKQTTKED